MKHRALTIGLVAMVSLVAVEYLAVATAMPIVAEDLGGQGLYGLAFSSALATGVIGMVAGGRWGDLRGPLEPLWTGIALFAAGLLLAGFASIMEVFIAARLIQGFGGALITVALYVVVARVYPESRHPWIFSLFAAAWVVPSIVGPAIVGGVTDAFGWQWVFLGVPMLTLPAAFLLWRGLRGQPVKGGQAESAPGLIIKIVWSALTAVGAALTQYGSDHNQWMMLAGLVVLAVTLPRLLPRGTLRAAAGLPAVISLRGLAGSAFVAAEVFVPLMLVQERGLTPFTAGLALTGSALTWSFGSWLQGREVFSRQVNLRGGMICIVLGLAGMATVTFPVVPLAVAYPAWMIGGLGMGLIYPTLSVLTLELSEPGEQGANSGALQVGESVYSVMAIALSGALFNALGSGYLAAYLFCIALALIGLLITPRLTSAPRPAEDPLPAS